MRRSLFFSSLAVGMLLVGCNQPQGYASSPVKQDGGSATTPLAPDPVNPANPSNPGKPVPAPVSPNGETEPPKEDPVKTNEELAKEKIKTTEEMAVKPPTIVKPGTDGWVAMSMTPGELGSKVDAAISSLKDVAGSFDLELRNAELEGSQKGVFLVSDPSLYRVDFVDLADPTMLRRVTSDGTKKKVLGARGWQAPVATTTVGKPVGNADIGQLATRFPEYLFGSLTERRATWEPLLKALEAAKYDVVLETKSIPTGGVNRPYVRLLANRKGAGVTELEVRYDGIRFVPLTVRMNGLDAKGRPISGVWRGAWQFNQKVKGQILEQKPVVSVDKRSQ